MSPQVGAPTAVAVRETVSPRVISHKVLSAEVLAIHPSAIVSFSARDSDGRGCATYTVVPCQLLV